MSYPVDADTLLPAFATAPKGVEPLLAAELTTLGAHQVQAQSGGVSFRGDLACLYRACLWSRTATRILLPLSRFPAPDADSLYRGVTAIAWEDHLAPEGTLAVDFVGTSQGINHSRFGAQKVKDAVVDRLRQRFGRRPSVDRERPSLRLNCHLNRDQASLGLDLSGDSLHRRGYRRDGGQAPLKENLAAALLLKVGWPEIAAAGGTLLDPLCGSGTLVIEAALMAADRAPGLTRDYWGFLGWRGHRPRLWNDLLEEARQRGGQGPTHGDGPAHAPRLWGQDQNPQRVRDAQLNAARAGVQNITRFQCRELAQAIPPPDADTGLLITNPPYGERLGASGELDRLYATLGDVLKSRFGGWQGAVFTGNPELGKRMGLKARRVNAFYNGPLPCKLLDFAVTPEYHVDREALDQRALEQARHLAEPFANRIRKNLRTLGRWARREGIDCYRLYDADIPEFAVAVDIYDGWALVQEYEAPASVDSRLARQRLQGVLAVLPELLELPGEHIVPRRRQRRAAGEQYRKLADTRDFIPVREGPARLWVNLHDYLDTGLFLDHRPTRLMLGELARGREFLNLFGYTGSATVHAALGGAAGTTTVDLSQTYLDWARRNLALNGFHGPEHRLIRADCLDWLQRTRERFDVIFLDPPTHSRSKAMQGELDLQTDHPMLIRQALRLLRRGGVLIFSTNYRRFRLDREALPGHLNITDLSAATLPRDFQRRPDIHRCWRIEPAIPQGSP